MDSNDVALKQAQESARWHVKQYELAKARIVELEAELDEAQRAALRWVADAPGWDQAAIDMLRADCAGAKEELAKARGEIRALLKEIVRLRARLGERT